jgi:hypothetical protein
MMTPAGPDAPAIEQTVELSARENTLHTVHIIEPKSPLGAVILFPGGDGKLRDYAPPNLKNGNFLIRSRGLFVERGFATVVMDAPSDQPSGMWEFRIGREHRADIAAVIAAGGAPEQSDPCKALSHHGYLGIERQVVAAIANWMSVTPGIGLRTK